MSETALPPRGLSKAQSQAQAQAQAPWPAWLPALALALNGFAIVTVGYWILRARALFIATHPDYVDRRPPTISRAISDPAIGDPFSVWITLAGALLVLGVWVNVRFYLRLTGGLAALGSPMARVFRLGAPLIRALQAVAGVGMHILSVYRFPDHNGIHMLGSVLFFGAQAGVILVAAMIYSRFLRDPGALGWAESQGHIAARTVRFRARAGWAVMALTVFYVALFLAKDFELGAFYMPLYRTYTTVEPILILAFLGFLALVQGDLWRVLRVLRAQRASSCAARSDRSA